MEFSGSWLFTAAGDTVSELSPKLRLRNAALVPEKRLQVGDQIGSMRITLKPGEFFLREAGHERAVISKSPLPTSPPVSYIATFGTNFITLSRQDLQCQDIQGRSW